MQVRQLLRNGQTEAGAIVLGVGGGVEVAVKHGGLILRRDAAAGVRDLYAGLPVLGNSWKNRPHRGGQHTCPRRCGFQKAQKGIQAASPVDSYAAPEPSPEPGYTDEVVMASGSFTQGSTIELSCDGPLREPYTCYLQGGLNFAASRAGVLLAIQKAYFKD